MTSRAHGYLISFMKFRVVHPEVTDVIGEHRYEPVAPEYLATEVRGPRLTDHSWKKA